MRHPDGEYDLRDFTALHASEFVDAAYAAVLGRQPDPVGRRHYLDLLHHGARKSDILGRIRFSKEGRNQGVRVKGLAPRFALLSVLRIPIVGRVLSWLLALAEISRRARLTRQFEAYALLRVEQLADEANRAEAAQQRAEAAQQRAEAAQRNEFKLAQAHRVAAARAREALGGQLRAIGQRMDGMHARIEEEAVARRTEGDALRALSARLDGVGPIFERVDTLAAQLEGESVERERIGRELGDGLARMDGLSARLDGVEPISERVDTLAAQLEGESVERERIAGELGGGLARMDALHVHVGDISELLNLDINARSALEERFDEAEQALARLRLDGIDRGRRLDLLLQEARRCLPDPLDQAALQTFADEEQHQLDALYVSLGDTFRGSPRDIKSRVAIYLPYVREAKAGSDEAPVLDLGCGRGEWLELLGEQGFRGRGVDTNRLLVEGCHALDLEVTCGDAIEYLCKQPDGRLGAVTAFHLLEHLPIDQLIRVLDETLRVLRPGGISIFETPNPANLQVGSHLFYMDPTHRNPLPSRVLSFLAEARGFTRVSVVELHPFPKSAKVRKTDALAKRFNELFYGPQDYAIVGHKA